MANAKTIEDYLIGDENSFLLNENNDGKVVMISGKWGCGKTHFWRETIMNRLGAKHKQHVYISLYGKDSLEAIQNGVFINIYNEKQKNRFDMIAKSYSVFSFLGKSFSLFGCNGERFFSELDTLNKKMKITEAEKHLTGGGIICFDDFERKSTNVDLNDLFGFITQLALELRCKIVIILNEEYFESKDAETFSRVKEKTVNKFISFEPTIDELFEIIYKSNKKYEYFNGSPKEEILKSIKEADELNARIYFQILDNCLEYFESRKGGSSLQLRTLTLATIIFTKYNRILNPTFRKSQNPQLEIEEYLNMREGLKRNLQIFLKPEYSFTNGKAFYDKMKFYIFDNFKTIQTGNPKDGSARQMERVATPNKLLEEYINSFEENKELLWVIYFYAYKLGFRKDVTDEELKEINDFVKNGIIEKKQQN